MNIFDNDGGLHKILTQFIISPNSHQDGNLEQGDKILSINGESFMYLTRDKALRILKQLQSK